MKKYRSKPVVIEAIQFSPENNQEILELVKISDGAVLLEDGAGYDSEYILKVKTLEGIMVAKSGYWIIKGTEGEFYPCKDSVFKRKYEDVN